MTWKTAPEQHERWAITFDAKLPILVLVVDGVPNEQDAVGIGRTMYAFAQEVQGPWAIISDLRKMPIADEGSRGVWVANMKQAMGMGLSRWSVINDRHVAAIQSKHVANEATMREITRFSFDMAEGQEWAETIRTVKTPAQASP